MKTDWTELIATIPDYPKPGILFQDLTPVIADGPALKQLTQQLADHVSPYAPTHLVGIEARGFIFGAALALQLGLGLTVARKSGKLPRPTFSESYSLEYGDDRLEIHQDALGAGDRVIMIDDILATGGTALATAKLIAKTGATLLSSIFVMELEGLGGRAKLETKAEVHSLLQVGG